jgi:hypothetical protein
MLQSRSRKSSISTLRTKSVVSSALPATLTGPELRPVLLPGHISLLPRRQAELRQEVREFADKITVLHHHSMPVKMYGSDYHAANILKAAYHFNAQRHVRHVIIERVDMTLSVEVTRSLEDVGSMVVRAIHLHRHAVVKYSFHWNVSMGLIVSALFTELRSFPGGRIPFTPIPRRADPKCIRPENFPLRSTRSGDTGPGAVDEYLENWDASDPSCISHLMNLFSHLEAETSAGNQTVDEAYFKGLQAWAIDGRRWPSTVWLPALVSASRCENRFIPTEGVTEAQRVIANAMRRSPLIHVMMLRTEVGMSNMFQDLMEHFAEQVWYDPLTDIFNDPAEQIIADKDVKKESECRKFQAAVVYTAETWLDYTIRAGVSALEEHRYRSDNHTHSAQAVILPIKETWFPGEGYHLAFVVVAKFDESSKRKPFLQEGDRLVVTIRISSTKEPVLCVHLGALQMLLGHNKISQQLHY